MEIRVHWTARSERHVRRHRVRAFEVDELLNSRRYYLRKERGRYIVIGRAFSRFLFLVLEPSAGVPGKQEVVTARDATVSERHLFRRRRKGAQ